MAVVVVLLFVSCSCCYYEDNTNHWKIVTLGSDDFNHTASLDVVTTVAAENLTHDLYFQIKARIFSTSIETLCDYWHWFQIQTISKTVKSIAIF